MKLISTLILVLIVLIVVKLFFDNDKKENFNQEINYENEYQIALIKSELSKEATKQAEDIANSAAAVAKAAAASAAAVAAVSKVAENKAKAEKDPEALTVSSEIVSKAATTAAAATAAIAKFTTNKANTDKETAIKKAAEQSELETKLLEAKKAYDYNKPKIWNVFWSTGEGSVMIMFGNKQALYLNVRSNGTVMNTWDGNNWGTEISNINIFHNTNRPFNFKIKFFIKDGFTIEYKNKDIANLPNRFNINSLDDLSVIVSDPNNILVTTDIPKNILDMRPMGWFDASTFNPTSGDWFDKVSNNIIKTTNSRKADDKSHVFGDTNATINNVPWPGENKDYTFIHLSKYNGNNRGRIWTGTSGNWLSGFWNKSVSFFHEGWYDSEIKASNGGNNWLLTVDNKNFVRVNKGQYQKNGPSYGPASVVVNNRNFTGEVSDWAIAEFIIFDRVLSEKEYTQIEDYLSKKYLETKIEMNYPLTKNFNAPLGEYSSNCGTDCNCHMDFKVLYEVTKNNIKYRSLSSNIIGTANNCPNYWNPTLYFTITNKPNINEIVNLVLLVSKSGKNDWYYTTAQPITLTNAQEQNIRIIGGTATFGEKYNEQPMAEFYEYCDYQGYKVNLGIGEWNWSENVGIQNDSLSSVKVPLGLKVILYYDADYQGGSVELTKDTPCLTSTGINDLTSSIKIMRV